MLKDVLWTSPAKKNFDPLAEKQKYGEKIIELVQIRTTHIVQIKQSLSSGPEKCYFLKSVDVQGHISTLEDKYEKEGVLKNYLLLGSLLSTTLDLPNSLEKLIILWKMMTDYHEYIEKGKNHREKFLISDLARISLKPQTTNIKISIVESTYSGGKLSENINNLLDVSGLMHKLSKKMIQVNGNKSSFHEKRIFTEYLDSFYKAFTFPSKMSFTAIVVSTCEILLLVYNSVLTDELFYTKETCDIIDQIDSLIHSSFLKFVSADLHQLSAITANKEFEILERSLEATFGKSTKGVSKLEALMK